MLIAKKHYIEAISTIAEPVKTSQGKIQPSNINGT